MKNAMSLVLVFSVFSFSAMASKARLEALGEGAEGSQFISDNRNIFLNAASLNYHRDFVTYEWGDSSNDVDSIATPRAEGGFFKSDGNFVYGLNLGSAQNFSNIVRSEKVGVAQQNNVDVFIAGDAGVLWGANITYHTYTDKQDASKDSSEFLRTRLGVIAGDTDAFFNLTLKDEAESGTGELEVKSSFHLGASHLIGDMRYMIQFLSFNAEDEEKDEFSAQRISLGVAKEYRLNEKSLVWVSGFIRQDTYTCDFDSGCNTFFGQGDTKDTFIPVSIALETSVKDWLVLRGSVSQNVYGVNEDDDGKEKTMSNTTSVRAGASLVFGDFQIDGVVGNSTVDDGSNEIANDTSGGEGLLRTDNLMSRVSMTYKF